MCFEMLFYDAFEIELFKPDAQSQIDMLCLIYAFQIGFYKVTKFKR